MIGVDPVEIIEDHGNDGIERTTLGTAKNNQVKTTIPATIETIKTGNQGKDMVMTIETVRPGVVMKILKIVITKIEGPKNQQIKKFPSHQDLRALSANSLGNIFYEFSHLLQFRPVFIPVSFSPITWTS